MHPLAGPQLLLKDQRDTFALMLTVRCILSRNNLFFRTYFSCALLYADGFKHLRAHVATAAFDSYDNVDAPKCHPNTRMVVYLFKYLVEICLTLYLYCMLTRRCKTTL